ncbi:hypothetical protein GGF50DRAFT_121341 [Schizophyllum commune]
MSNPSDLAPIQPPADGTPVDLAAPPDSPTQTRSYVTPTSNAKKKEKLDYRRRRNTLAARRSRQKKADKMATLEDDVRRLTSERDTWKTRAQTLRQLLLSHGIPCKEFED